jgi:hypothetical protein
MIFFTLVAMSDIVKVFVTGAKIYFLAKPPSFNAFLFPQAFTNAC